jgi:hypothetical protein
VCRFFVSRTFFISWFLGAIQIRRCETRKRKSSRQLAPFDQAQDKFVFSDEASRKMKFPSEIPDTRYEMRIFDTVLNNMDTDFEHF